jgi:hypothetical protein
MGAIVDRLTAAGVRAVVDERDIAPPCVMLRSPSLAWRFGKGGWSAEWVLWAVVPDSGTMVALENLDLLMEQVQQALAGAIVTATPITVGGIDGSPPVPGYALTWTDTIR